MEVVSKDFKSKLDTISNKVELKEDKAYQHYVKAEALRINGLFDMATKEYHKAIFIDKNYAMAYKGLGMLNKNMGNFDEAVMQLKKAIDKMPFDKQAYNEMGVCFLKMKKPCCATKFLKRAIKIDHNYIEPQFNLAIVQESTGDNQMAHDIYDKIIEQRPSYLAAYNNKGSLYLREEKAHKALEIFKNLIDLNPEFVRAYLGLGLSYDKLGRKYMAQKYYKKYLELKPSSENAPYIMERMKDLSKGKNKPELSLV